ncbi:IS66 family insertion sequence element accessory protein TnpA [Bacillus sp. FJAT-45350]|uniref:IS66 family insertion sequence element accessory protein TnpA n=1 Tax=Bacillus sp. FJAT-45350 TaxID=2011014 RepID=UPI000BB6C150|nr:hypothetical protein [Bacillus sp. FJAT-45350]
MTKTEKSERQLLWQERVASFKESGQSVRAWCAANDVKEHQFRYWLKKVRPVVKNSTAHNWLAVKVEDQPPTISENSLTIIVNHVTIEVKPGFDPNLLKDVVKALNT